VLVQRSFVADAYAQGLAFHKADHCQQASERYASAERYKLAFSAHVGDAGRGRAECEELLDADGLAKDREVTIDTYERFLAKHPASVLRQAVRERAAAASVAVGKTALDGTAHGLLDAMRAFEHALSGYPDTESAGLAGRAAAGAWEQMQSDACEAVESADLLADEQEFGATPETSEIVARSGRALPSLLLGCARSSRRAGEFESAVETYERFLRDYRGHPTRARASTELIATRVDFYAHGAKKPNLPPPSVSGSAPSGTVEITITNASPETLELLVSGPRAARSLIVPACGHCKTLSDAFAEPSCDGAPTRTMQIPFGSYDAVARATSDDSVTPFVGKWNLGSGIQYSRCYYISTAR
jgi:tetratricopeptide (TPR) repeat protein